MMHEEVPVPDTWSLHIPSLLLICLAAYALGLGAQGGEHAPPVPKARAARPSRSSRTSAYAAGPSGLSADPTFFPLAVWLQDPGRAHEYRELGINTYVGSWKGPTDEHLVSLRQAGIRLICGQQGPGWAHAADSTIAGWMHGDEPDNAQPRPEGGYGPGIPPAKIIADYQEMKRNDATRPVLLNLGQGVANDEWIGIGCKLSDYPEYVKGCDIVSYDVYPVVGISKPDGENYLWYVARGLDRLREWTAGRKLIWNCIECTHISNPQKKATPHQVRAEVWMSLIHGSMGIIYFVHQFKPTFIEAGLLADQEMSAGVKAINQQIIALAPVLNSPTVADGATVTSASAEVPIDIMLKQHQGVIYLFAVGIRNAATRGDFWLKGLSGRARAEVLGENRQIVLENGAFSDEFEPYGVHLYRITRDRAAAAIRPRSKRSVAQILTRVDEGELRRSLFSLSKDPLPYRKANFTRRGQSKSTLEEADDFIESKLRSWGYGVEREAVQVQAFRCDRSKPKHAWYATPEPSDPWYTAHNLHARKIGATRPEEIICVVSHKDSPSWVDSPGAQDNAVGTVGNLEIARLLAKRRMNRTIWLLFCNEEHVPWTSVTAAQRAKARGDNLIAVFNLDALGGKSQQDRRAGRHTNVTYYTRPEGARLAELMAEANQTYGIGLVQTAYQREQPGDDDGSFINAGYPAAVANIGSHPYADPNYHAEGDVPELVDLPNVRKTVQATLAAILTLDAR